MFRALVIAGLVLLACTSGASRALGAPAFVEVPGSPFATGTGPYSVSFSPTGALLATSNDLGNATVGTVSVFSVASNGALAPVPGSPFAVGNYPRSVAFAPDGALLATANYGDDTLSVFSVGVSGALTPVKGSPFQSSVGLAGPDTVSFSPNGKLLAVACRNGGYVDVFSVAPNGALTEVPGSPFGSASVNVGEMDSVAFSPDGTLLATENSGGRPNPYAPVSVSVFSVASSGALTEVPGSPFLGDAGSGSVTFSPNGRLLVSGSDVYSVLSSGALAEVAGSPFATGADSPAFSQSGSLLATTSGSAVAVFSVASSGALSPVGGSPFAAGASVWSVAFSPNGWLLAAANHGANTVSLFSPGPPAVNIAAPASGGIYPMGRSVSTQFSCADALYGPGLSSCTDSTGHSPPNGRLDTSSVGTHNYTVTAVSLDGRTASATLSYTVAALPVVPPPATASVTVARSGAIDWLTINCRGYPGQRCAGSLTLRTRERMRGSTVLGVSARKKAPKPPVKTVSVIVSSGSYAALSAHSVRIALALNATGRRLLATFYTLPTALAYTGAALSAPPISFAYPLVTMRPDQGPRWAIWRWYDKPCMPCSTMVDNRYFFGIPQLLRTARVTVRCAGAGCPHAHSFGPGRRSLKLNSMFAGRHLGPGAVIELRITAPNSVGRVVRWAMVAGDRPLLVVKCLPPGARTPVTCAGGA